MSDQKITKKYQWLYQQGTCPLWEITNSYLTKENFKVFMNEHNEIFSRSMIHTFKKIKVTKIKIID